MKKITQSFIVILILSIYSCGSDDNVKTCTTAPTVSAGEDQILLDETTVTLAGTSSEGKGTWSIVEGTGGQIHDGSPVTFTGALKTVYKLKWESTNDCGTSTDFVTVTLNVSCGDDQSIDDLVANIHWIQQACFRIESGPFTIYTDPNSITENDAADIILISHPHPDHYTTGDLAKLSNSKTIIIAPAGVEYSGTYGKRVTLKPGEEYVAFGCVTIKAVPAYNINKTDFHPKANNWVGYVITVNGRTIYHAGDTELIPEMKDITCDIAMLPLGQTYTFDTVADAVQAAKDVKAKVAIPMHFGLYEGTSEDALNFKAQLDGIIPVVIKVKGE
jgi:L-ascorbate metabolism protein UlaG (beta-lactamase superfamily)